ncbi:hypothetical protein [Micromonospora sp. KC723]|uniref:hypothetical protein n=1 Tax=Micromonospora sp. KC723 TaxID=2530381 RepID=UPI00104EA2BB|nr:hypothetical protein [Micromonospora sp. KC723]TDB73610.1 hypothetical protein E1165_16765 [Micromonospora sp. KC723]
MQDDGDCDELANKRTALLAEGKTVAACVTYGPAKRVAFDDMKASDILPIPQYCLENEIQYWYGNREEACAIVGVLVNVTSLPNNQIIGQMFLNEYRYAYGSSTYPTVAYQLQVSMYHGWGQIAGTTVSGVSQCTGACTYVSSDFPIQPVVKDTYPGGEAYFRTTATEAGAIGNMDAVFKYRFYNPSWGGSGGSTGELTASYPTVRCDNRVPGTSIAGCVFRDWPGVYAYSLTGPYAELAKHIHEAQQAGLPGAYPGTGPNSTPLKRLIFPREQQANRLKACPTAWPRPATKSCDEYPMASTYQGAHTGGGTGRTFSWCSVSALPTGVTGPSGWSSCMIDQDHNSLGGSDLDTYLYRDQRILDSDPFYIQIVP